MAPESLPSLGEGEIAVWALHLARIGPRYDAVLSPDERARAERFMRMEDRRQFRASHGALRIVLARHTGRAPPEIAFLQGENGRPRLDPPGPDFNLAHSGDYALVAIAASGPVGVDIERRREVERAGSIARHHFTPEEARVVEAARCQSDTFLTLWTCKEAVVKATGEGLVRSLASFDVRLEGEGAVLAGQDGEVWNRWSLRRLTPFPDAFAALALPSRISRIHLWSLD